MLLSSYRRGFRARGSESASGKKKRRDAKKSVSEAGLKEIMTV